MTEHKAAVHKKIIEEVLKKLGLEGTVASTDGHLDVQIKKHGVTIDKSLKLAKIIYQGYGLRESNFDTVFTFID